jgi:hypothetical protein
MAKEHAVQFDIGSNTGTVLLNGQGRRLTQLQLITILG